MRLAFSLAFFFGLGWMRARFKHENCVGGKSEIIMKILTKILCGRRIKVLDTSALHVLQIDLISTYKRDTKLNESHRKSNKYDI